MFRNYQIVIFKDRQGVYKKLRFRGWLVFLLLAVLAGGITANFLLVRYYYEYNMMEKKLGLSEKTVKEQSIQLLSLADKMETLENDLERIRDFDSKLRLMVNLERKPQNAAPLGEDDKEFADKYLPMYKQEMMTRKLHRFLNDLANDAGLEEIRQKELLAAVGDDAALLASIPSVWPVEGWISSGFGKRTSPFSGKEEFHKGVDISAPPGAPVHAPADGVVGSTANTPNAGGLVVIDHKGGLSTSYGNLKEFTVTAGSPVTRGECIGYVGDAGQGVGPHLYYEIRLNGLPVNPSRYLLDEARAP